LLNDAIRSLILEEDFMPNISRYNSIYGTALVLLAGCAVDTVSGSPETVAARAQAICTPPDPCPPIGPPPVSTPDVGFQFFPCLPEELNGQVLDALRDFVPGAADVKPPKCMNGTTRLGVWFAPVSGFDDDAARDRGLDGLSLLQSGETFAGFLWRGFLTAKANNGFADQPKRIDPGGAPNPDGPIHLSSLDVAYTAPNQVSSFIHGYDERPWPDVDFTLRTTDSLGTSNGRIQCMTSQSIDVDTGWLNALTGLFFLTFPPLGAFFLYENIVVSGADAPNTKAGSAACPAVRVFPAEIMLPGAQKVVVSYARAEVNENGIVVGGTYGLAQRSPSAAISGPRSLQAAPGDATSQAYFSAAVSDLRHPIYTWTSSGTVAMPNDWVTFVTFYLAGHDQAGDSKNDTLHLHVVDADGLTADADAVVSTTIMNPDDDGLPPICKKKPYLPQCQL
jgi:hypothetical protein